MSQLTEILLSVSHLQKVFELHFFTFLLDKCNYRTVQLNWVAIFFEMQLHFSEVTAT
jgi:hypothetical protein